MNKSKLAAVIVMLFLSLFIIATGCSSKDDPEENPISSSSISFDDSSSSLESGQSSSSSNQVSISSSSIAPSSSSIALSSSSIVPSSSSIALSSSSIALSSSSIVLSSSSIVPSSSSKMVDSPVPVFQDVTVHDPSVFLGSGATGDKYRIIGSFLGSAKTDDFIKWTMVSNGGKTTDLKYYPKDNSNTSIQKVADQRAGVIARMNQVEPEFEFFASDVHKMPNGKFYHYYGMTSNWMGSIGVAIADAVDGNYITQGLFVHHNNGNISPSGIGPNCIDQQAFFDKSGKNFYMVYGSYSGGFFMYEMDIASGLPKTNSTMNAEYSKFGRKILHSIHWPMEAPYIIYSPDTDYYYLFVSYGGLAAADGYNIRIFRSRNPDGPYTDARNTSALNLTANNYAESGVKIVGGYQFAQVAGENAVANKFGKDGFLSPGHNSAYYDAETGKYFLIHHTRAVNQGEGHSVRVREMFVNEDGWLVAAPFRYDAGTIRTFNKKQLTGAWKILDHGRDINKGAQEVHTSALYTFNENGSITGAATGTWTLGADGKTANIVLEGKTYKGVFLRSYDEYHSVWVYAFTALSSDGIALWGATPGVATDS